MLFDVDGDVCSIRDIQENTDTDFRAQYRGNTIHCWLDTDDFTPEDNRYYIQVTHNESGMKDYDGWMPEEAGSDLHSAVVEAIRGACLTRRS